MTVHRHRWWIRLLGGLVGTLFLGGLLLSVALQLPAVRAWLLEQLLVFLNRRLEGTVSIGDLRLRGLSGLEFSNVVVRDAAGDTLLAVPSLRVAYEPLGLTRRRISLPTVFLESPSVVLVRGRDGLWNFERLLPRDTTPTEPLEISIWLRGFRVQNARVLLIDSLAPAGPGLRGQTRWSFQQGELLGSALVLPHQQRVFLSLRSLRFREAFSGLELEHLHGHITLSPTLLRVEGLRLRFPGLGLQTTATLRLLDTIPSKLHLELFGQRGQGDGSLLVDSLVLLRLRQWFPELPPVAEQVQAQVHLAGTLQRLRFDLFTARLGTAQLSASGVVSHLNEPRQRHFEGMITAGFIPTELLARLVPGFPPEGRRLRFLRLRRFSLRLTSDSAAAHGKVSTALGDMELRLSLQRWASQQPSYSLWLRTSGLAFGSVVPLPVQPLVLAGTLEAQGVGSELPRARLQLRLRASQGTVGPFPLHNAQLTLRLAGGFLQLDTAACWLLLPADTAAAQLTGWVNMQPVSSPSYRLALSLRRFPVAALLGDTTLPSALTATVQLSGQGVHLDSLSGFLRARVEALEYPTWALFPFEVALQLSQPSATTRFLQVTGDYFTAQLSGTWRLSTLPALLRSLAASGTEWVAQRTRFLPRRPTVLPVSPLPESAELRFRIELRDLAWLERWTEPLALQGSLSLDGQLSVAPDTAFIQLDRLALRQLTLRQDSFRLYLEHFHGSDLSAGFRVRATVPELQSVHGRLTLLSLRWMESSLDSLRLDADISGTRGMLTFRGSLPEVLGLAATCELTDQGTAYQMRLPELRLSHYPTGFIWENAAPVVVHLTADGISIDSLALQRWGSERILVRGMLGWDSLPGLRLTVRGAPLADLLRLVPLQSRSVSLALLTGRLDSLQLTLTGALRMPSVELQLQLSALRYDTTSLGTFQLAALLHDSVLTGTGVLQDGPRQLRLRVSSCPSRPELFSRIPLHARVEATDISAALLSPFLLELRNLQGSVTIAATLWGHLPDELQAEGTLTASGLRFQLVRTGVTYQGACTLRLRGQAVVVEDCTLRNLPEDLPEGKLQIRGTIGLRELRPWSFDLRFSSPQVLVLSSASARASLPAYGVLILSTGQPPLQLVGTWEHPRLIGTLLIRRARLIFPAEALTASSTAPSLLADYYWHAAPSTTPQAPQQELAPTALRAEPRFAERLFYDLRIYLLDPLSITMDLAPTQQLVADLEPENPSIPLAYVTGPEGKPQLLGRLRLLPGSVYKFYRNFAASGTISFTTGEIDNPELDIEVRYRGTRVFANQRQSYEIRFTVRGTRRNPSIGNWSYTIAGTEGTGDENQLFNDVIWLLLVGQTQQELEGSLSTNGASFGREIPLANLSTLASKAATELFRGLGIVQDVQIDPTTGTLDLEQMRARITGQLGGITLRWGGTLGNPLQLAEFTVDIPLSELLRGDTGFLRQVLLQLSTTTGSTSVTLPSSTQRLWEVRLSIRL